MHFALVGVAVAPAALAAAEVMANGGLQNIPQVDKLDQGVKHLLLQPSTFVTMCTTDAICAGRKNRLLPGSQDMSFWVGPETKHT